CQHSYGTPYSV
nr:immunoglobulin light chain junction region [Macaca mulatta]